MLPLLLRRRRAGSAAPAQFCGSACSRALARLPQLGGTSLLAGVRLARDGEHVGGSIGAAPLPQWSDSFGLLISGMGHAFAAGGRLEVAAGPAAASNLEDSFDLIGLGYAGVRVVPSGAGFTFRIGMTLVASEDGLTPWPSVSLGRVE